MPTYIVYPAIFIFAMICGVIGIKLFRRLGILDTPWKYKDLPPRDPVPTVQGIMLVLGVLASIGIFWPSYYTDTSSIGLIIGGAILGVVALIDNFYGISPKLRLLVQIAVVCIVFLVSHVGINEIVLPHIGTIDFPMWIGLILTVIWFIGFINAINWLDGINGLATGSSSIGFLTILLLINIVVLGAHDVLSPDKAHILTMTSNLSWILLCFSVVYAFIEFKPYGLVRDIGVMFLGFNLAYLSLLGGAKIGTISVALSLIIFDSIWVFVNRIFVMRKNPMKGDLTHLHHRLLCLGFSRSEVRFFIWGWSLFLMILMILQSTDRTNKIIIFTLMFLIFFGINSYLFWVKKLPYKREYKGK